MQGGHEFNTWLAKQPLRVGQAVWVCKSKGVKKSRNGTPSKLGQGKQALEPFLRAKIHELTDDSTWTTTTINDDDDDDSENHRITVIYPKGSTYRVKRSHLWPIYSGTSKMVVVWPETDFYRRCCLQHTVAVGDYFVEIGCDYGTTVAKVAATFTASLSSTSPKYCRRVLGIDKSDESIVIAKQRYPHYPFIKWDVLEPDEKDNNCSVLDDNEQVSGEEEELSESELHICKFLQQRRLQVKAGANLCYCDGNKVDAVNNPLVVAMDINGNRELQAVQECLTKIQALWQPRLIIVKSRALHQLVQQQQDHHNCHEE